MIRPISLCALLCLGSCACFGEDKPDVHVKKTVVTEETLIGPYEQPEWTTHRRFPTTRVYLQKTPWEVGFEQWWRSDYPRDGKARHRFREEVEIGLPHRLQLDLYEDWVRTREGTVYHQDVAAEIRYALADWGKIPLNPTLYFEWKFVDGDQGPDKYEAKLLLGEIFARDWHWGLNLVHEQEVGEARETEWAASQAISYTMVDSKFSVGTEMKYTHTTEKGGRDDAEEAVSLGPSFQWRPTKNTHLDVVPLFGLNDDAPELEAFVVFGVDLGKIGGKKGRAPVSLEAD